MGNLGLEGPLRSPKLSFLLSGITLILAACGSADSVSPVSAPEPTSIVIEPQTATLGVAESLSFQATVFYASGQATVESVSWSISDGYVFVAEESNRPGVLHVVDVSDLSNPVEVATFRDSGGNPHNFWLDEVRGILYVAWWRRGLKAIDVNGELLGQLDTQGRLVGSIAYGDFATRSWGAQLHDGLVYVSETSGLWVFRPEF